MSDADVCLQKVPAVEPEEIMVMQMPAPHGRWVTMVAPLQLRHADETGQRTHFPGA